MRAIKVGLIAALLGLGTAGTAAASCGDTVADAICMLNDAINGPGGLLPAATQSVETVRAIVFEVILVVLPGGGWL